MQRKLMIGAFVLLALLFVGATAHRNNDSPDLSHPSGFTAWLGRQFGGPPNADRADLSAPCLQQDRLEVHNGTCTLKVAKSDAGQRNVRLHSDSAVAVQAPAPGQDTLVRSDVEAGGTVSVTVSGDGADIDVICAGDRTCTLTLVKDG